MWLPNKLYEFLPWAYVLIGLLFVAGVMYLDQGDFGSGFYFAFGVVSIACGLIVHYVRSRLRARATEDAADGDATVG